MKDGTTARTRPLRVLIADDVRDAADSLAMLARLWGHDARVVYDGAAALEVLSTFQPDVFLLDVGMPKMNGFDLAHELRRRNRFRQTLLIAITGYADHASRDLWGGAFDHYLVKPIEPVVVQELLLVEWNRLTHRVAGHVEPNMSRQFRVVAFDLDSASLNSLHEAFPEWDVETVQGVTAASLAEDAALGAADLLVVKARAEVAAPMAATPEPASLATPRAEVGELLGLCRGLRSQVGWARTPLLVLVPPAQDALVTAVLKAGASSCLVLPVHSKDLAHMMVHALAGDRPGRHTLNLDRVQEADRWRDEGGEA